MQERIQVFKAHVAAYFQDPYRGMTNRLVVLTFAVFAADKILQNRLLSWGAKVGKKVNKHHDALFVFVWILAVNLSLACRSMSPSQAGRCGDS